MLKLMGPEILVSKILEISFANRDMLDDDFAATIPVCINPSGLCLV